MGSAPDAIFQGELTTKMVAGLTDESALANLQSHFTELNFKSGQPGQQQYGEIVVGGVEDAGELCAV